MDIKTIEELAYEFAMNLVNSEFGKAHSQFTSAYQLIWPASSLQKEYADLDLTIKGIVKITKYLI